ncbi:MAG: hypothetical protein CMG60_09195, partial [Candidatus Marinimicrobia bacterium]|nr:hypothetical protein [Candidatus Neomarinimicrobiota bacterium]
MKVNKKMYLLISVMCSFTVLFASGQALEINKMKELRDSKDASLRIEAPVEVEVVRDKKVGEPPVTGEKPEVTYNSNRATVVAIEEYFSSDAGDFTGGTLVSSYGGTYWSGWYGANMVVSVDLPAEATSVSLSYWKRAADCSWGGSQSFTVNGDVLDDVCPGNGWGAYSFDLSSYAGQTITLSWNSVSSNQNGFYLDDVYLTYDDGAAESCEDSTACNFGAAEACTYPATNYDCDGNCIAAVDCAGVCGGSSTYDYCGTCGGGATELNQFGFDCDSTGAQTGCSKDGIVNVTLNDSFGDGWGGNTLKVTSADSSNYLFGSVLNLSLPSGSSGSLELCIDYGSYPLSSSTGSYAYECSWEIASQGTLLASGGIPVAAGASFEYLDAVYGCTSATACNFNSSANQDDGSCVEPNGCGSCPGDDGVDADGNDLPADTSCYGCTDPTA